jgi:hypothetical protein
MKRLIPVLSLLLPVLAFADGDNCIKRTVGKQLTLASFSGDQQEGTREYAMDLAARNVQHQGPMSARELWEMKANAIRVFTQIVQEHRFVQVTNLSVAFEPKCEQNAVMSSIGFKNIYSCTVGEVSGFGSYSYWDCPDANQ